jgi:hypothetical protein
LELSGGCANAVISATAYLRLGYIIRCHLLPGNVTVLNKTLELRSVNLISLIKFPCLGYLVPGSPGIATVHLIIFRYLIKNRDNYAAVLFVINLSRPK